MTVAKKSTQSDSAKALDSASNSGETPDLDTVRHSCAHVMAAAISELRPQARFGVGPTTENGFFYDVLVDPPLQEADLTLIETKMKQLQKKSHKFVRVEVPIEQAVKDFDERGQLFKVRLLEMLQEHGSTKIADEVGDSKVVESDGSVDSVSTYQTGDFVDLCRGPHVKSSRQIGYFKLTSIAGAYWRGDEKSEQLQRVYGICYDSKENLSQELERLEEVKKRDHRVLGKKHDLFKIVPEVGSGLPLWLPKGTVIRDELEYLAKETEARHGYRRVATPHLTHEQLYFQSGHLPYYRDDMYSPVEIGGDNYYLKPMNCPHHHHIYLAQQRSYRDLPLRLAEYGQVYRYEDSGALSGIIRSRGFCQNDAHIYCTKEQALEEFLAVMRLHQLYYEMFDIEDFYMRLSMPDMSNLDKYVDNPEAWEQALNIIVEAMEQSELPYEEAPGDAAFYGPKIDFIIRSAIGTEYAISTNQLDFLATERFDLTYTGSDGEEHPVYVIHRAPLGSHERFIAFLIEHYKASFPFWLAPVQLRICPLNDNAANYGAELVEDLLARPVRNGTAGLRVELDLGDTRINKKIRTAAVERVPLVWVIGDQEAANNTVSLRDLDGVELKDVPYEGAVEAMIDAAENRRDVGSIMEAFSGRPKDGSLSRLGDKPTGSSASSSS